ncbi:ATP--guanido phosphotransferase [Anaerococcus sp. NML200537]|uniref:ATP--guanido phosphotransferase n=1 Tax=Anaerococcus sp. NML200537 TaxID=2954485 RepID=UPI0022387337|nr:ATP--guanido phosphotransferase [Anaerococcus sp. NML200537]MCW6702233.1 ATP--guanido phosphotransferase [Anaerococcus sp. NML200537]
MKEFSKDIIISSNLSLRRNLKGYDFPTTMTYDESLVILDIFKNIFDDKLLLLSDLDDETIDKLIDQMILSEDAPDKLAQIGVVFEGDTTLVINDRDHLSINISGFDLDLNSAYMRANEIEKVLDEHLDFAFSGEYGYLTSGARNSGNGLEIAIKAFLFGLIDNSKTYFGFKQAMVYAGMFPRHYIPKGLKSYADKVYLLKNYGNYREDVYSYLANVENDLATIVKNERRFRRDYKILNNIDDRKVREEIKIIENQLANNLVESRENLAKNLYDLKKYRILEYDTSLDNDQIDYLLANINSHKYKDNFDQERSAFLKKYMGEHYGKQ